LFEESFVPGAPGSGKLFDVDYEYRTSQPVECLGLSFPNVDARRGYFTERLREKLKDPEFRKIEGFPIGDIDEIVALSDPPYYTACPNPFLGDMIEHYGKAYVPDDGYRCEPLASDVSVGKNDTIYIAHSYPEKLRHEATQHLGLSFSVNSVPLCFKMMRHGPHESQVRDYENINTQALRTQSVPVLSSELRFLCQN